MAAVLDVALSTDDGDSAYVAEDRATVPRARCVFWRTLPRCLPPLPQASGYHPAINLQIGNATTCRPFVRSMVLRCHGGQRESLHIVLLHIVRSHEAGCLLSSS